MEAGRLRSDGLDAVVPPRDVAAVGSPRGIRDRTAGLREYSLGLSKDIFFGAFQKLHFNGAYFGGHRLDRFTQYQFGMFDETRMHGVPSAGVRFGELVMARGSYSFNVFDQVPARAVPGSRVRERITKRQHMGPTHGHRRVLHDADAVPDASEGRRRQELPPAGEPRDGLGGRRGAGAQAAGRPAAPPNAPGRPPRPLRATRGLNGNLRSCVASTATPRPTRCTVAPARAARISSRSPITIRSTAASSCCLATPVR